uniref:Uncharacterized protein n=1 Tax=Cacopsylla melanoneura TaxID=428564 RepID=A0A8D9E8K5_9HEMI
MRCKVRVTVGPAHLSASHKSRQTLSRTCRQSRCTYYDSKGRVVSLVEHNTCLLYRIRSPHSLGYDYSSFHCKMLTTGADKIPKKMGRNSCSVLYTSSFQALFLVLAAFF